MLKKFISAALILSILWPTILQPMNSSDEEGRKSPSLLSSPPKDRKQEEVHDAVTQPSVEKKQSGSGNSSPEKHSPREKEGLVPLSEKKEKAHTSKERSSATSVPNGYDEARSIFILRDTRSEKREKDDLDVPEVGSLGTLPSDSLLNHGSWEQHPRFPLVPMRSNGSIQEGQEQFHEGSWLLEDDYETLDPQHLKLVKSFSEDSRPPSDPRGGVLSLDPQTDLDSRVIAFLQYADKYIKRGRITWKQGLIGGIGGGIIGIGVGNAMPAILSNGLDSIGQKFHQDIAWNVPISDTFITHTAVTLGVDSWSRNSMILGEFTGPSTEKFSIRGNRSVASKILDYKNGINAIIFLGAGLAALLPVYYLWRVEESDIKFDHGDQRAQYMTFFYCLAPTLWFDSLFMNARGVKSWFDEKIDNLYLRSLNTQAREARNAVLSEFNQLERFFKRISDEDIDDIYEQVLRQGLGINRNGVDLPDLLEAGEGLRVLKTLFNIKNKYNLPPDFEDEGDIRRLIAKGVGLGIPVLATVGRSLVFYTIIFHMLGDLGLESTAGKDVLSIILGGGIASLFQGKVEFDTTQEGAYELMFGENTDCDASHNMVRSGARKVGKSYTYLQGAWNTLPYLLVGLAATQGWPLAIQICTLIFFGLADTFNNAMSFNESYGGVICQAPESRSRRK